MLEEEQRIEGKVLGKERWVGGGEEKVGGRLWGLVRKRGKRKRRRGGGLRIGGRGSRRGVRGSRRGVRGSRRGGR